jgi:tetratricopeptide (TPR) repeat protein
MPVWQDPYRSGPMIRHDVFEQPVTLPDAASLAAWDATMRAFLSHGAATPLHLGRLLDLAPDHAGAWSLKGLFLVLLGRREVLADAAAAHARAVAIPVASQRERALQEALGAMLLRRPGAAIAALEAVLEGVPSDTLLMKLSHALRFVIGDAGGMRASVERAARGHAPDHAGRGYTLGCHAFALEETGAHDAAVRAGHDALNLAPDDAWGLHAVAHVHDMRGDAAGGIGWLEGREAAWSHCNNFRYHVWWHKALMLIELRRLDAALTLYDAEVRAERTDDYRDIANATSLLTRLELEGIDVGMRWEELADLSERRTEDGCLIFADLHYLLALTGDGRGEASARMLARLIAEAVQPGDEMTVRTATPGLAAARGLTRFGAGEYGSAFDDLKAARSGLQAVGGSHAQRDVFERITIDAGLRAGRLEEAAALLDDRTHRRGGTEDGYAAARRRMIADAEKSRCDASGCL